MNKLFLFLISFALLFLVMNGIYTHKDNSISQATKIKGVNFVAPDRKVDENPLSSIKKINANWIAICPYAFGKPAKPDIIHDTKRQWWGERTEGVIATTEYARRHNLKVMLKPQVWIHREGWTGDFSLETEEEWNLWEQNYEAYLLPLASLADSMGIEMLCIGTEYRLAVQLRPAFWKKLIKKIRERYKGKLTYAANWDNYQNVSFWGDLDFIGINPYFPLSETHTPSVEELIRAWKTPFNSIESLQKKFNKPVIFTEYGYRSIDKAAWKQWEFDRRSRHKPANLDAQLNAYQALYQTFWKQPWFAGGFLWKWYDYHDSAGGGNDNDYTPQNKPVEKVISRWYGGGE